MEEQRTYKRARIDMKVSFKEEGPSYKMGHVENISKGGMFVNTDAPLDKDIYILASIDAEELGKIIWAQGRIVRKTDNGMAVVFTRTDEKGLNTLLDNRGI